MNPKILVKHMPEPVPPGQGFGRLNFCQLTVPGTNYLCGRNAIHRVNGVNVCAGCWQLLMRLDDTSKANMVKSRLHPMAV